MSWITDEANKNNERENREAHQRAIITQSNYWARLLRQIEADVNEINGSGYWQKKLAGFPLRFEQSYGGEGHQISKSGYPAVLVKITHKGDHVDIERHFTENPAYSGATWAVISVHRGQRFRNHRGQRFRFIVGTHFGAT